MTVLRLRSSSRVLAQLAISAGMRRERPLRYPRFRSVTAAVNRRLLLIKKLARLE